VRPLEVVVNSSRRPEKPYLLNVDQVRAGVHAVSVIGESGYAEVRIVDEQGTVVFRTDNKGQRIETDDDGDVTIIGGEAEVRARRLTWMPEPTPSSAARRKVSPVRRLSRSYRPGGIARRVSDADRSCEELRVVQRFLPCVDPGRGGEMYPCEVVGSKATEQWACPACCAGRF
jgi:hypothetical protein